MNRASEKCKPSLITSTCIMKVLEEKEAAKHF